MTILDAGLIAHVIAKHRRVKLVDSKIRCKNVRFTFFQSDVRSWVGDAAREPRLVKSPLRTKRAPAYMRGASWRCEARRTHAAQSLSLPGVPAPRKRGPGHYPRGVWAENLAESSGTEKGFAGARLASPLKGLGHRAHTCGERHGGTEQTAHRQRTDSAQTTHRQRTDSAQRLSCVFRKRKRRFKSDQP